MKDELGSKVGTSGTWSSASSYSMLLSLLKYVESSNRSHIFNAAISLLEKPAGPRSSNKPN